MTRDEIERKVDGFFYDENCCVGLHHGEEETAIKQIVDFAIAIHDAAKEEDAARLEQRRDVFRLAANAYRTKEIADELDQQASEIRASKVNK